MGAPVEFSSQATDDLREIVAFIARDNPARAETFGETLLSRAQSLGDHPRRGRIVPAQSDHTVREIVHGAYRIIYRVTASPDQVSILRFWHAARGTSQIVED